MSDHGEYGGSSPGGNMTAWLQYASSRPSFLEKHVEAFQIALTASQVKALH
jgi:hypothetical protein